MKERVEQVRQQRETAARGRDRRLWPTVGIVGYTNAGKSTLLNALVGSEVARAEDKLFATLDPTSRQVKLGDGQTAIVTDTVGFIHKLPHQLVDAFRATLEEVNRADVLIEVVDASDAHFDEHRVDRPDRPRRARCRRQAAPRRVQQGRPARSVGARRRGARRPRSPDQVFVSALTGLRPRHAPGRDRGAAGLAVGRRRRRRCRTPPASCWRASASAARSSSSTGERDVRVRGRVAPALAGELEARRGALGRSRRSSRPNRSPPAEGTVTAYLRRAGAGSLADGAELVWSVADGRRGRRWRAVASVDGLVTHALLLEVDLAGRPSRLELTTPAGLLTLHPEEGSGRLHGNVVTGSGVRHLALPWSDDHGLEVHGRPIAAAVTAHRLAASHGRGGGEDRPGGGDRRGPGGDPGDPPLHADRDRGVADRGAAPRRWSWRSTSVACRGWLAPGSGRSSSIEAVGARLVENLWTRAARSAQVPRKSLITP